MTHAAANIDVFALKHSDMVGINLMVASHKLNVLPTVKPTRQKVRRFYPINILSLRRK